MYKWLLVSCFWMMAAVAPGQTNLIPNPSFEDLSGCPKFSVNYQIDSFAIPWFSALETPDIYNACAGSGPITAGVPINRSGNYQRARTGNGYAGLQTYLTLPGTTEYLEVKLLQKLKKGNLYYIRFFVSPSVSPGEEVNCYSDAIALAFSDTLYRDIRIPGEPKIPPFTPAIENPVGRILKDTINWIEVSNCYQAKGGELFAIIGGFRWPDKAQDEDCIGLTGTYHLIDDVGVYEFNPLPDTLLLCEGETLRAGGSFLDGSYYWNTGSTDSLITITQGGQYVVEVDMGSCVLRDTVEVIEENSFTEYLPRDTALCEGSALYYQLPTTNTYEWADGYRGNSRLIEQPGTYDITIQNECGTYWHSFEITPAACDCGVYMPNVFTPNGDGTNDVLTCHIHCDLPYEVHRFAIFDRWGNQLFYSTGNDTGSLSWDGYSRGQLLQSGVYGWVLEYEVVREGITEQKILTGDVTILR